MAKQMNVKGKSAGDAKPTPIKGIMIKGKGDSKKQDVAKALKNEGFNKKKK